VTTTHLAILIVILAMGFFLLLPSTPYISNMGWGYYPSVVVDLAVAVVAWLMLRGTSHRRLS
jgi:hypothetical protein